MSDAPDLTAAITAVNKAASAWYTQDAADLDTARRVLEALADRDFVAATLRAHWNALTWESQADAVLAALLARAGGGDG